MYKQVLQNKPFLYYLLGGGISRLGDVISGLAFLFLAHDLTQSTVHVTGVVIAETAPYLLFGLVGGVIADWVPKRKLLIWIDLLRAPIVLSVYLLHHSGQLAYWHLLFVGFLIQSLGCFFNPAHRAVLPMITMQEERTSANSLVDTMTRGMQVFSPVITVTLLNHFGVVSFFVFDASTYLCSAVLISLIRLHEKTNIAAPPKKLKDVYLAIHEYLSWVKGEPVLRKLFVVTFLTVFFNTWVWEVGVLVGIKGVIQNGEAWYSTLLGTFGGIVILSNLVIPFIWKRLSLQTYLLGSLIWGLGVLSFSWAITLPLYFVAIAVAGIGMPLAGLSRVYVIQQLVPEDKLGRGFSFNAMLLYLSNVLSLGLFGLLSVYFSLTAMFLVCGTMMILSAMTYLYLLRKARGETPYIRLNS